MKTAFPGAFTSWIVVLVVLMFWPGDVVRNFVSLTAVAFTVLWLLHFAFYTARVLAALWSEYIVGAVPPGDDGKDNGYDRRDLLRVCGSALSLAVLAAVWLPTSAFARGQKCGTGYCPDDRPKCCSRSQGKCCNGNWACTRTRTCHATHAQARGKCGRNGVVWACG